jgi:hydroxyethylthiazole kinase-like uncharacterized protein yjeF
MDALSAFKELLTPAEMGEADRLTIAGGVPGMVLMERAGAAVADEAERLLPDGRNRVLVLCGPGNNGGDGFVAARDLAGRGFLVSLALLGDPAALKGDAAEASRLWTGPLAPLAQADFDKADLVIDALFGAGLARDLDGEAAACVAAMNEWSRRTRKPIVAVDVPSGVDGATGEIRGIAPQATVTVTFFRLKPGHLLYPGRELCGRIVLAEIGIRSDVLADIAPQTFANNPHLWGTAFPIPKADGHKYTRGHGLVLTGGPNTTGAGRMAARGALRAGAGLVTVASPDAAMAVNAAHLTAIMLTRCDTPQHLRRLLEDRRKNVVVLGPGLGVGPQTRELVLTALEHGEARRAMVLDADALTAFENDAQSLRAAIATAPGPVVLTPHEGEFGRLFEATKQSRLERARAAARFSGAIVVLKGPDTIVAHPDGRVSIAFNAPPWLATAGAGDVLAGFIGGLLAQGMDAFEAASCAVWLHGECARLFGPGLIAEDLPEILPRVLGALYAELGVSSP